MILDNIIKNTIVRCNGNNFKLEIKYEKNKYTAYSVSDRCLENNKKPYIIFSRDDNNNYTSTVRT